MSFEEIVECDDFQNSDCEIEVMDTKFEDISSSSEVSNPDNHLQLDVTFKSVFETWWPETAILIIHAMFSSEKNKHQAINRIMDSFEHKHHDIEPIKMISEELHQLHSLYKSKLDIHTIYLNKLKNTWCEIIRVCGTKCKLAQIEKFKLEQKLASKAQEMHKMYAKISRIKIILHHEFQNAMTRIDNEFAQSIKSIKNTYVVPSNELDLKKLNMIDADIKALSHKFTNEHANDINILKQAFLIECKNIDATMIKSIHKECQEYWLDFLNGL